MLSFIEERRQTIILTIKKNVFSPIEIPKNGIMKKMHLIIAALSLFMSCGATKSINTMNYIDQKTIELTIESIQNKAPITNKTILYKGVQNAGNFWKKSDGSTEAFTNFCINNFATTSEAKFKLFSSIQNNLESINGHFNRISMDLKAPVQLVGDEYTKIDESFAALDPYAHFADDMFDSKIAFSVLLNFPFYTLEEKNTLGDKWSRQEWAYARMGDLFTSRIPAALNQKVSTVLSSSENYISNYNIRMDKLRTEDGRQLFADSLSLITHWGLRDELNGN